MQTLRVCVRACSGPKQKSGMAIYHLSVKTISRSAGRTATAAAAYRAAVAITDMRTGEYHDYRRKRGVELVQLVLPMAAPAWATDRAALWNAAEVAETRKNSTVAREFEIALPSELTETERQRLALDFAREIVERHGCAVDVAVHGPGKDGDERNHHAHILCTTRRLGPGGFGEKTRELDDKKTGEVDYWRERFARLQNERLREAGRVEHVDHRSLEAQGIDRAPTHHLGPAASAFERRTGQSSRKRIDFEQVALERLSLAKMLGELEREQQELTLSIIDLSNDLREATSARDREASAALIRSNEIRDREFTKGEEIHGNESKSGTGIWTFERTQSPFETYELDTLSNRSILEAQSLDDLRDLSSVDVVPGRVGAQVLLPGDALDQLAERKTNTVEELRRSATHKRSLSQGFSDLQRYRRQLLMGTDDQHAAKDNVPLAGLSRDTLGNFFAEQLMTAHLRIQEDDEHERLKPPSPP